MKQSLDKNSKLINSELEKWKSDESFDETSRR